MSEYFNWLSFLNLILSVIFIVAIFLGLAYIWPTGRKKRKWRKLGFERLMPRKYYFFMKDETAFLLPFGHPEKAKPIEIVGISEIRSNSRLVQLEIRYRIDGRITSARLSGTSNDLLNAADKLGYGG